jgi:transcriptional regulator with PAS, ATPase and Fis domain
LSREPHLWIEGHLHIVDFGVAMKDCDYRVALLHARHAVDLAEQSGAAAMQRSCYGNLAYVLCAMGNYDDALSAFDHSMNILPSLGTNCAAVLETAARVKLAQGRLVECEEFLARMVETIRNSTDRFSYGHREAALTRARLFARQDNLRGAIAECDNALSLARTVQDDWLETHAVFAKAEFTARLGEGRQALGLIDGRWDNLLEEPLDLLAQYERLLGTALATGKQLVTARPHFERARRLYVGIGDGPETSDLDQQSTTSATDVSEETAAADHVLLHDVASMLAHAGRPELLARQVSYLMELSRAVDSAAVMACGADGSKVVVASFKSSNLSDDGSRIDHRTATLMVGKGAGQTFEVHYVPKTDIESLATINSIRLLLAAAQEIDRARAERERTLTLWPVEDEPPAEDGFILIGRMGELMAQARRVAKAHITVLITGESGTGKEVLARAVHKYSDRAARPFVPFNCAAIPRDLVESHLFGHRRGAFTGADRDSPGIIRGARGGTIFLDEVGELSLDLQPKLLRFLESGEIAPVGDAAPSIVDVRVVAATNAKLETAVNEGRFREDLFYRLNVVRLDIPPLRERRDEIGALVNHFVAATALEFGKGFVRLAEETMEHLLVHRWPGNVRQLQNEVRRIVALAESDSVIPPDVLAPEILNRHLLAQPTAATGDIAIPVRDKLLPTLSRIEREMIKAALRDHGGRVEAAAKALGISRKGLYLKRQRLGL